jgi:phosphopentomutase
MPPLNRIVCIVLDGVGAGEAADAASYGDAGSNSLANTAHAVGGLRLPRLERLGLGNVTPIDGVATVVEPRAAYGSMMPAGAGKDSTTGHWELMGCVLRTPLPTYPDGFPEDIIARFENATGRHIIGNRPASGTRIIEELGRLHLETGRLIVYTSQDSVFQIAAHTGMVPLDKLYHYCEQARRILEPPHHVARVIARPFCGEPGRFYRTDERRDFSLEPPEDTVLDAMARAGMPVASVGKVAELFCGRGIAKSVLTHNNREGIEATLALMREGEWRFILTNLVDFDTMWGHRNDARAYALGLEEFDSYVDALVDALGPDDLLIITSDHGNDPTTASTDHSREKVPLLAVRPGVCGRDLGVRQTFADVATTVAAAFGLQDTFPGESFLAKMRGA